MRKWTYVLAAAALSALLISACASNATPQATTAPQTVAGSQTTDAGGNAETQTASEESEEAADESQAADTNESQAAGADESQAADTDESSAAAQDAETEPAKSVLVVYFSATGNTGNIANTIAEYTNADRFELIPVNEYSAEDLDWTAEGSQVNQEHDDESLQDIELVSTTVENFDTYETIFIGYPIWWRNASWVVNNFIKENDFTGKTVIPFCTSSSSGLGESAELLAEMAGTGDWQEGIRFQSSVSEEEVITWVESLGLN